MPGPPAGHLPGVASSSTSTQKCAPTLMTAAEAPESILVDIGDRVIHKEKARDLGFLHLTNIFHMLGNGPGHHGVPQDLWANWHEGLKTLKQEGKDREILVGILGDTGLGKSSLINALLGYGIVPTNQSEACTATVCSFRYNHESENKRLLVGKVAFKSWETVEAELDAVKEEIDDLEQAEGSEGCEIRNAQLQKQLATITIWSGLKEDEIREMSPEKILENSAVFKAVFKSGKKKAERTSTSFQSTNKNEFLQLLATYTDSSNRGQASRYWPLVEHVEISLKAEILRHGIKLVDLPGDQDFNVSRGQIARNWMYHLDKRIVVAPATRAADNKTAAGFIFSEGDAEDLEVDEMLNHDSLCVVITKTDEIDTKSARSEFPTKEIIKICDELQRREDMDEDEEEELTEEDDDLVTQAGKKRPANAASLQTDWKRRRLHLDSDDLSRLTEFELKFRLTRLCIEARNKKLEKRVKEDFLALIKKTSPKRPKDEPIASVFPVSSKAFQDLKKGRSNGIPIDSYGFPDPASTGIPALKSWLNRVSCVNREEWVDSDIHHIHILLDAVDGWCQDDAGLQLPKLSSTNMALMKTAMKQFVNDLEVLVEKRVRGRIRTNLIKMKPLRESNLKRGKCGKNSNKGQPEMRHALANLARMVEGWQFKNPHGRTDTRDKHTLIHWSTYKACIRRRGRNYCTTVRRGQSKSQINWIADIQRAFWRGHRDKWQSEFMKRIPKLKSGVQRSVTGVFSHWITTTLADDTFPDFLKELIKNNAYKLEHILQKFATDVRLRITELQNNCRVRKELILSAQVSKHMNPGFDSAWQITGKGILKRQANELKQHVDTVGPTMFNEARNELEQAIFHELGSWSMDVKQKWQGRNGCKSLITAELNRLLRRCDSSHVKPDVMIQKQTRESLLAEIGDWRRCWQSVYSRLPRDEPAEDDETDEENDNDKPNNVEETEEKEDLQEQFEPIIVKTEPHNGWDFGAALGWPRRP